MPRREAILPPPIRHSSASPGARGWGSLVAILLVACTSLACTSPVPTIAPPSKETRHSGPSGSPDRSSSSASAGLAQATPPPSPSVSPRERSTEGETERLVAAMTLEEKVGQLIVSGFAGTTAGQDGSRLVRRLHLGGVVLLATNWLRPAQLKRLTADLQRQSPRVPLLVAVDHEGGTILRFGAPVTHLPDARRLGELADPALAWRVGRLAGEELLAMGVNVNLAPVLDVNDEPRNPVIGPRSFGAQSRVAAEIGRAYIEGLEAAGVVATAKHFPGHGHTTTDSHRTLPVVRRDRATLDAIELRPFREAIAAGVGMVMTAHVLYPALDPHRPATLSPTILGRLLREELGFRGPIMTDALGMAAISRRSPPDRAAVAAIKAGADLLLVTERAGDVHRALLQAVSEGGLSERRIDESVRRILRLKLTYRDRWASPPPLSVVGSAAHRRVLHEIPRTE